MLLRRARTAQGRQDSNLQPPVLEIWPCGAGWVRSRSAPFFLLRPVTPRSVEVGTRFGTRRVVTSDDTVSRRSVLDPLTEEQQAFVEVIGEVFASDPGCGRSSTMSKDGSMRLGLTRGKSWTASQPFRFAGSYSAIWCTRGPAPRRFRPRWDPLGRGNLPLRSLPRDFRSERSLPP
jgi:hypothetical protein